MSSNSRRWSFTAISFIVALFFVLPTAYAYPITGNAINTEEANISAGVTPDSPVYFLDVALDNINLALTFDSNEKAKKGLRIARERLMEVRDMADKNDLKAAQTAQQGYENALSIVQDSVRGLERKNATEEFSDKIEIERDLEEHKSELENIKSELSIKIKVKGNVTSEQQAMIDSILASLEGKAGEVEIEIENEKDKTKLRIEQETGKSSEEVEDELNELEEAEGLTDIREERARDKIADAENEISKARTRLVNLNQTGENIDSASELLAQARDAYNSGNYKEAANLAKRAEHLAEQYRERFEENQDERNIDIELEEGIAKVDIEVGREKMRFSLENSDLESIVNEISARTGLTKEEVKVAMNVEAEPQEIEQESKIKQEETSREEVDRGKTKTKKGISESSDLEDKSEERGESPR